MVPFLRPHPSTPATTKKTHHHILPTCYKTIKKRLLAHLPLRKAKKARKDSPSTESIRPSMGLFYPSNAPLYPPPPVPPGDPLASCYDENNEWLPGSLGRLFSEMLEDALERTDPNVEEGYEADLESEDEDETLLLEDDEEYAEETIVEYYASLAEKAFGPVPEAPIYVPVPGPVRPAGPSTSTSTSQLSPNHHHHHQPHQHQPLTLTFHTLNSIHPPKSTSISTPKPKTSPPQPPRHPRLPYKTYLSLLHLSTSLGIKDLNTTLPHNAASSLAALSARTTQPGALCSLHRRPGLVYTPLSRPGSGVGRGLGPGVLFLSKRAVSVEVWKKFARGVYAVFIGREDRGEGMGMGREEVVVRGLPEPLAQPLRRGGTGSVSGRGAEGENKRGSGSENGNGISAGWKRKREDSFMSAETAIATAGSDTESESDSDSDSDSDNGERKATECVVYLFRRDAA